MNTSVPCRDSVCGVADSCGPSGPARPVPGAGRLVGRAAAYQARTRPEARRRALGFDLASHSELTVRASSPELVSARAENRILVTIEALASTAQVVRREYFRFVDRADVRDRLVVALFVLDNQ